MTARFRNSRGRNSGSSKRDSRIPVWQYLALSVVHFVVVMVIAFTAFGLDMDQLRSRSRISRVAAAAHDVLWFPHDAALRQIPNDWLIRNTWVIPLALIANSLVGGALLFGLWTLFARRRTPDVSSG